MVVFAAAAVVDNTMDLEVVQGNKDIVTGRSLVVVVVVVVAVDKPDIGNKEFDGKFDSEEVSFLAAVEDVVVVVDNNSPVASESNIAEKTAVGCNTVPGYRTSTHTASNNNSDSRCKWHHRRVSCMH